MAPPSGALAAVAVAAVLGGDAGHDGQARDRRRCRPGPCRPARTGRTRGRRRVVIEPGSVVAHGHDGDAVVAAGRPPRSGCPAGVWRSALVTRLAIAWRRWASSPATTTGSGASRVTARSGAVATASLQASAASTARSTGARSPAPRLVEAGEQEQVLDQDLHAGGLLFDAAQDGGQVDSGVVAAEPEQLGESLDRRERRAQLVGRVGQELAQPQLGRVPLRERRPRCPRAWC